MEMRITREEVRKKTGYHSRSSGDLFKELKSTFFI